MKLWLAHDIQNYSLTQEFQNEDKTAASRLPFFIEDKEAQRLNTIANQCKPENRANLDNQELSRRLIARSEVNVWVTKAMATGFSLRMELSDFVTKAEKLDPTDTQYWNRVNAVIGLGHHSDEIASEASGLAASKNHTRPNPQKNVLSFILGDAVTNILYLVFATAAIMLIGSWSRQLGIALAVIETIICGVQSVMAMIAVFGTVLIFILELLGKYKRQDDEKEMRWGTVIRLIETCVRIGCLLVLYYWFFTRHAPIVS
jgi:hypothetical protein